MEINLFISFKGNTSDLPLPLALFLFSVSAKKGNKEESSGLAEQVQILQAMSRHTVVIVYALFDAPIYMLWDIYSLGLLQCT